MDKKKRIKTLRDLVNQLDKLGMQARMEVDEKDKASSPAQPPRAFEVAMARVPPGRAAYIQTMNLAEVICQLEPKEVNELYWYSVELSAIEGNALSDIFKTTLGGAIAQTLRLCFEEFITRGEWPRSWPHGTRLAMAAEREVGGPRSGEPRATMQALYGADGSGPSPEAAIPMDLDYLLKAAEVFKAEGRAEATPEELLLMAAQIREMDQGGAEPVVKPEA